MYQSRTYKTPIRSKRDGCHSTSSLISLCPGIRTREYVPNIGLLFLLRIHVNDSPRWRVKRCPILQNSSASNGVLVMAGSSGAQVQYPSCCPKYLNDRAKREFFKAVFLFATRAGTYVSRNCCLDGKKLSWR
ncbi:hypothetical protein V5799_003419 [Amblyomma americanum]|uniref:Uncharacterized protein n=1 Tax=Amblyomma americanum TaxID=6943 RepID=A0AAQ4D909_AMBAM